MRYVRSIAAVLVVAFLLISPKPLQKALQRDPMRELFENEVPDWYGVIEIWHIAGFRTYQGSVTTFLQDCCDAFAAKHPGVHFEVKGLSAQMYQDRVARGLSPDAYSFPAGFLSAEQLQPLQAAVPILRDGVQTAAANEHLYAAPYLMSGYFLLLNEQLALANNGSLPDSVDSALLQSLLDADALTVPTAIAAHLGLKGESKPYEDFLAGKHTAAVADARSFGDILRDTDQNLLVSALPLYGYTDEVMYLGAAVGTDDHRAKLIGELYAYLASETVQQKVTTLGAMPVRKYLESVTYASRLLEEWNQSYLSDTVTPDPFAAG